MTYAFHLQCYASFLLQRRENPLEKQVPSEIREHVDDDGEMGNSLRQKLERIF